MTNQESGTIVYSETLPVGLSENLVPGIYTITAEDMNGCTIESGTIYISEPGDSLSIIFNSVDASCLQNNGSCTIDVDGGTPLYQYNWDDGTTTTVRNGLAAGYYPITVIDSRGCEIRDSAFVKGTHNVFADSLSEITYNICLGDNNIGSSYIKVDWTVTSDERDKTDIADFTKGLSIINSLRPVSYKWDMRSNYSDGNPDGSKKDSKTNIGLIAQEVLTVEKANGYGDTADNMILTNINVDGNYGMQYSRLIPILINAIKELSTKVTALEAG